MLSRWLLRLSTLNTFSTSTRMYTPSLKKPCEQFSKVGCDTFFLTVTKNRFLALWNIVRVVFNANNNFFSARDTMSCKTSQIKFSLNHFYLLVAESSSKRYKGYQFRGKSLQSTQHIYLSTYQDIFYFQTAYSDYSSWLRVEKFASLLL